MTKVLIISGPIGLGHVGRELEIAKELRRIDPSVEIIWYAEEPASKVMEAAGESGPFSFPQSMMTTEWAEKQRKDDLTLNLHAFFIEWSKSFPEKVAFQLKLIREQKVDIVVGDEAMELMLAISKHPEYEQFKFLYLTDFLGSYQVTHKPMHMMATWVFNKSWSHFMEHPELYERFMFIGEREDIKDMRMGLFLPKRTELAAKHIDFVGYIVNFQPSAYQDQARVKAELGYDASPLVVCTGGGTSAALPLFKRCAEAYPILAKEMPDLRMELVLGPRIDPETIPSHDGLKVKGYVPDLYKHMAASDLAITTAGGTTTLELTALRRPFLYFPFKEHFEQINEVVPRLERHHAGVRMDFSNATPEALARAIIDHLGERVDYPTLPLDGAKKVAEAIRKTAH